MKANKTKQLIYELVQVAFGNRELDNKRLHDMCQVADDEVKELERLAEIGKMYEWATESDMVFNKFQSIEHLKKVYLHHVKDGEINEI